jgi:AcrR family transcriptional regulator
VSDADTLDRLVASEGSTPSGAGNGPSTGREETEKVPVRPRGHKTRARLLEAATRVFIRNGYVQTRVSDINREARVSHGSFYTYFDSKDDIFWAVADGVFAEMYEALEGRLLGKTPIERLRAANRQYFEIYERNADMIAVIEQVATIHDEFRQARLALREQHVARLERLVRGIYRESDTPELTLDPDVVANALGGMIDNLAFVAFVLKKPFDREDVLHTLDEIWIRTLGLK